MIKCPRCNSTKKTPITDTFFHCKQCGSSYYGNMDNYAEQIVSSGKSSTTRFPSIKSSIKVNKKAILPVAVFVLLIVYYSMPYWKSKLSQSELRDIHPVDSTSQDVSNNGISVLGGESSNVYSAKLVPKAYWRTAYVLSKDPTSGKNYLFKAVLLTQNAEEDDTKVVVVKKENENFVGYDIASGSVIPSFNQVTDMVFSSDAMIVYSDDDNLIIKNKINDKYQLELINSNDGKVAWTLSNKELPGIDQLSHRHLSNSAQGIEIFRNNFKIKLSPNYFMVDKKGQIIGYGKLN